MNNPNNNYCVILAGGKGRRLWPCSRDHYPKQFIDFFGTGRTQLQQTYDRFSKFIPKENILISTNEVYVDIVKEQLKLLHFRNVSKAFGFDAELAVFTEGEIITFIWTNQGESATLRANLKTFEYEITDSEGIYA